jgi:hypothetical protein
MTLDDVTAEQVATFGQKLGSSPMKRPAQPEEVSPALCVFGK